MDLRRVSDSEALSEAHNSDAQAPPQTHSIWKRGVYQAGLRRTGLDEVLVHWHQATQEATTISGGTPFSKCLDLEIFL